MIQVFLIDMVHDFLTLGMVACCLNVFSQPGDPWWTCSQQVHLLFFPHAPLWNLSLKFIFALHTEIWTEQENTTYLNIKDIAWFNPNLLPFQNHAIWHNMNFAISGI